MNLTVRAGEHWALLGPNGAGKSTILGFCGALTHPTAGTVDVLGGRLGRVELQALRRRIGHVDPRHPLRSPLTIRDVVLTGVTGSIDTPPRWQPTSAHLAQADELIELLGLGGKSGERWPTLSQGERGRALIARALISDPGCCCSTSRPPVWTSRPASSCSKRSTCSPGPIPGSPRSWSPITSRNCLKRPRTRC